MVVRLPILVAAAFLFLPAKLALRYRILRNLSSPQLIAMLPPAYRGRVRPDSQVSTTAIIFRHNKGVVSSSTVARAIAELKDAEGRILAIGNNFSVEAQELLQDRSVEFVTLQDFAWTDENYERIKVLIGAKVKRPL